MSRYGLNRHLRVAAVAGAGGAALLLAACGPANSGGGTQGAGAKDFTFLVNAENTTIPDVLKSLSTDQCKAANSGLALKVETVPQASLDQKLQLLAGQSALPAQYAAGNAPALTKTLDKSGNVVDFEKALTDLGKLDQVEPSAVATIKSLYGGKFNVLPYQYNVEGIWFNKKLFADNGITEPQTWPELVAAADKLRGAGVVPFAASGEQGWPITRMISGYIFRDMGADALQKVADKQAKLTDPEYVKAADAVAKLGDQGDFGKGVGSIDYDTAIAQFLTGKAGMLYMGSWVLSDMNDKTKNKIGTENVGFMPFPTVPGGTGVAGALAANVGLPMTMSAKAYNAKVGAWLGCIADNYGETALKTQNSISGFKVNGTVDADPLTKDIQTRISSSKDTVLWFEALFSAKATLTSQTNAAQLVTGKLSAEDFMKRVQADVDSDR